MFNSGRLIRLKRGEPQHFAVHEPRWWKENEHVVNDQYIYSKRVEAHGIANKLTSKNQ